MPQYLVAIQHPDTFDAQQESPETIRAIDVLNEEMEAAGVRFFVGGLESPKPPRLCIHRVLAEVLRLHAYVQCLT